MDMQPPLNTVVIGNGATGIAGTSPADYQTKVQAAITAGYTYQLFPAYWEESNGTICTSMLRPGSIYQVPA